jgi:hypothetical protein
VLEQPLPDGFEAARRDPALEPPVDRGARAEFPRHGFPLASRAEHVEYPVKHAPRREPAPPSGREKLFDRQEHRNPIPHVVRYAPHGRHALPLPASPLRHPPLHRVVITTPSGVVLRGVPEIQC